MPAFAKKVNNGRVVINARGKSLLVTQEEADQILADLQIIYHMVCLGKDCKEIEKDGNHPR